jgi:hypothetical protein
MTAIRDQNCSQLGAIPLGGGGGGTAGGAGGGAPGAGGGGIAEVGAGGIGSLARGAPRGALDVHRAPITWDSVQA